ncbi:lipoate--protein ligase [Faecalibacter rhinopitheci]|uniref:lipoate--protein ligase n=1 Tax=Faecalibacter rhinopitheci TaxID=2779678 RepID=A0A8J7K3D7_9FLAO|nr:lipoate--protein ligase [Faecalibacter rhinopitheci]MBF0596029.1 lipoate--protein ligase [Faecalibacter rhinopitheci]
MLIIDSPSHDAYFNIALEEYLLYKYPTEDIFLLYINAPSIIVGKFQNTLAEINLDYVEEKGIKVVRRMSGGGAVYHDLGNLNFSFHTLLGKNDFMDFSTFTAPVIRILNELDVPAKLEGRNDLLVEGRKFSGNAKLARNGKMIQHGTILFNSDMSVLADALKVNPLKFVDKAVKSNRARVINLIEYLPSEMNAEDLKELLIEEIEDTTEGAYMYTLTQEDFDGIAKLINEKYNTWDWNFGFSPKYNFKNAKKIPAGFIEVHLDVERGGTINKAKIFGDFFASESIEDFEALLIGKNHDYNELNALFETIDLTNYFGKVTKNEILDLFK